MTSDWLVANLSAHWIQAGVLAAAALAAVLLLARSAPRFELMTLQLVLLTLVFLPLIQPWRPQEPPPHQTTTAAVAIDDTVVVSAGSIEIAKPGMFSRLTATQVVAFVIVAGVALRLLWLLYGVVALMRFSRRSASVESPAVAAELETQLGVSPRYIQQTGARGPWTFGFLRATVALPAAFETWAPGFQRAVICHELLHVKRRDMALAFLEELAVAMLWFHPWVWVLRARIRVAREQVVDKLVVALIGDRDEYVRCLVEISGHDLAPHFSQAGAGMLRPRELRARVDAIFQEGIMSRARFVVVTLALLVVVAMTSSLAAWAVPLRAPDVPAVVARSVVSGFSRTSVAQAPPDLAPATPQARQAAAPVQEPAEAPRRQTKMGFAEYPVEALEKGISGTVRIAITVSPSGTVTTASVIDGPEPLRASALKAAWGQQYAPNQSTTAMTIAVSYTLTGNFWGVGIGDAAVSRIQIVRINPDLRSSQIEEIQREQLQRQGDQPLRVGGAIRPPRKIADASPEYPELAQNAGVQGVVILEARIDEQGNVSEARVLRSIPLLDQAALNAVKQWKYEPTLMNGVPVPIVMTVTVNFTLRGNASSPVFRLNIVVPEELRMPGGSERTQIATRANDYALVFAKDKAAYGFVPVIDPTSPSSTVKIAIYRMNPNTGRYPPSQAETFNERVAENTKNSGPGELLGSVEVARGGGMVQSQTTPSFGIEFISIDTENKRFGVSIF